MGVRRIALRAGMAAALLLAMAAGASAGLAALHHGGAAQPAGVVMVVTAPPSPSQPATADFPAWTPAPSPSPTATSTPAATPRPAPTSAPRPTSDTSLPHCNTSYFVNHLTATRQPNGTVLIDLHVHQEWSQACVVPKGCRLGYTVYDRMGGPVIATDQPVHCTTWARYTGDFDVSALWSTCHINGDYQVNTTYGDFADVAYYTSPKIEPQGCPQTG